MRRQVMGCLGIVVIYITIYIHFSGHPEDPMFCNGGDTHAQALANLLNDEYIRST